VHTPLLPPSFTDTVGGSLPADTACTALTWGRKLFWLLQGFLSLQVGEMGRIGKDGLQV
jgi:hypothetical protein